MIFKVTTFLFSKKTENIKFVLIVLQFNRMTDLTE